MKGVWHWLKSSSKMKRWMFLILMGIVLACYGISEILVLKEMSFVEVGKIIAIFDYFYFDDTVDPEINALLAESALNPLAAETELYLLRAHFIDSKDLHVIVALYAYFLN